MVWFAFAVRYKCVWWLFSWWKQSLFELTDHFQLHFHFQHFQTKNRLCFLFLEIFQEKKNAMFIRRKAIILWINREKFRYLFEIWTKEWEELMLMENACGSHSSADLQLKLKLKFHSSPHNCLHRFTHFYITFF